MAKWAGWVCAALLGAAGLANGQTLARKGWAGSGISVEPWYGSAVFYELDPLLFQDSDGDGFGDLRGITARLPYLERLGVDAVVLSPLPLDPPGGAQPFDPTYGSPEDFDRLEREANARRMRIFVDLPLDLPREQLLATARFWLARGVAGLRLTGETAEHATVLREMRAIAGPTRILIGSKGADVAVASRHPQARVVPELQFDERLTVGRMLTPALLRSALMGANLVSDRPNLPWSYGRLGDGVHDVALARMVAAALLLGRGAPLLLAGQELGAIGAGDPTPMQWGSAEPFTKGTPWIAMGPNAAGSNVEREEAEPASLLNWYRRLIELHHTEAAVRTGTLELLPTPNANLVAWLRRPGRGSAPAVLVVVNLSPYATVTPLSTLLPGRTGTLKVLARSAEGAEPQGTAIPLEGYGVYVAEVQQGGGLENVVLPARGRRRR